MNKAIFLDRDGVLNNETGVYVKHFEDYHFNHAIIPFLLERKKEGFIFIVITNQGALAKGLLQLETMHRIHADMRRILAENDLEFAEIYYCPHHNTISRCICRKPDSLLLEKACARFNIDPNLSYFIGDHERDEIAGKKAGLNVIRIESNKVENIPFNVYS